MTSSDDDKGGFVVGGISFGFGPEGGKKKAGSVPMERTETLMPLRMIAVADLLPGPDYHVGAAAPEVPIAVEPGGFDGLFKRLQPQAQLDIESVLLEGRKVKVAFAPQGMKDFRPDGLSVDNPLIHALLHGRKVLERMREGGLSVEGAAGELAELWPGSPLISKVLGGVEVKQAVAAAQAARPAAPAAPSGGSDVDALLDMIDMGGPAKPAAAPVAAPVAMPAPSGGEGEGRFGSFIAAVAHSGKKSGGANPDEGIRIIDKALSLQLGAILQHPEFRRLEEVWRGVEFLAKRLPKHGVKLEVMCARGDDAPAALERAIHHGEGMSPPASVAVVDTIIDGDAASLARARKLADIGEANAVPVITNASPRLLGHDDLERIDKYDNKQGLFDAPERAPWRAEANRPAMLWLSMGLNRVFARGAYDKKTSRVRGAMVEELPNDEINAAVFMQPCWAVGSLVLQSFDKTGWPHRVTGAKEGGMVENLPVREVSVSSYEGDERVAIPTEVFFSTETQRALGRLGVLALAAQANGDAVYLMTAATAYVPPPKRTHDYDTAEPQVRLPQASLADQLFVARVAQFLGAIGAKISADSQPSHIEKVLENAMWQFFDGAPPGIEMAIQVQQRSGRNTAAVTIRPHRFLGVSLEEITLGVPLA